VNILFSLLLIFFNDFAQQEGLVIYNEPLADDFKLVKTDGDILFYERWITRENNSQAREVKIELTLHATLDSIISIIKNEEQTKIWNKNLAECEIIEDKITNWITYYKYSIPWPLNNQDCVLYHWIDNDHKEQGITVVYFKGIEHNLFERQSEIKRLEDVEGKWEIEKLSNGKYRIAYFITTTPSSSFPRWLADPIIRSNLISSLSNFRKLLEY
jgi:hypothetical protein